VRTRLNKFLDNEREREVSKVISLEQKRKGAITLDNQEVKFNYTIDRIDEFEDGSVRVIDYKTGSSNLVPKKLSSLLDMPMNRKAIKDNLKSFQLPLYYYFIQRDLPNACINAEMYNIKTLERKVFISDSDYPQRGRIMKICLKALTFIFEEIIDPKVPFSPDHNDRRCQFCPFGEICA
jgi:CRISPR/Cas system-associated exonuclease Cas4 (RecB family)